MFRPHREKPVVVVSAFNPCAEEEGTSNSLGFAGHQASPVSVVLGLGVGTMSHMQL